MLVTNTLAISVLRVFEAWKRVQGRVCGDDTCFQSGVFFVIPALVLHTHNFQYSHILY